MVVSIHEKRPYREPFRVLSRQAAVVPPKKGGTRWRVLKIRKSSYEGPILLSGRRASICRALPTHRPSAGCPLSKDFFGLRRYHSHQAALTGTRWCVIARRGSTVLPAGTRRTTRPPAPPPGCRPT